MYTMGIAIELGQLNGTFIPLERCSCACMFCLVSPTKFSLFTLFCVYVYVYMYVKVRQKQFSLSILLYRYIIHIYFFLRGGGFIF